MNEFDILVASSLGLGLAAASGFRVFIPPFLYGLFLRLDMVPISIPMTGISEWMASDIGLIILGVAMIVEILGYYVPWIDNLLDTIASPAAIAPIRGIFTLSIWVFSLFETFSIISIALALCFSLFMKPLCSRLVISL